MINISNQISKYGENFETLKENKIFKVFKNKDVKSAVDKFKNNYKNFEINEIFTIEDLKVRDRILNAEKTKMIIISKYKVGNLNTGFYYTYDLIKDEFIHNCKIFNNETLKDIEGTNIPNELKNAYYDGKCKITTELKTEYLNYINYEDKKVTHIIYIEFVKIPLKLGDFIVIGNKKFEIIGYQNINEDNLLYEIYCKDVINTTINELVASPYIKGDNEVNNAQPREGNWDIFS